MLKAPEKYSEEFYRGEIDGQKRRLQRLKERLEARKQKGVQIQETGKSERKDSDKKDERDSAQGGVEGER